MRKYIFLALGIILVGIIISSVFLWLSLDKKENRVELVNEATENISENVEKELPGVFLEQNDSDIESEKRSSENEEQELPIFVENSTPFISQAPFGVWDELHDEACEEATIIIANGFLNDIEEISKEKADKEILALVDWQMEKYGKHKDLNLEEIQDMALNFYEDKLEISEKVTLEEFKKIIASGKIIIIPSAGRELGNPFFTPPGPLYHALVVIGYDDSAGEFITNDPGTRRGEGFRYSYENLLESIHDFPGKKEKILEGEPRVLVVEK